MEFKPEKRKTQIDFSKLGLSSHPQTYPIDQVIPITTRKYRNLDAAEASTEQIGSPIEDGSEKRAGLKALRLPDAVRSILRAHEYLKTTDDTPWNTYEKLFDIRLGEDDIFVTVAELKKAQHSHSTRKCSFSNLALVRSLSGPRDEDKLRKFQQITDINIVSPLYPLEVFRFERNCYVAFEYMTYSLYYITGNSLLNEIRLAAIAGQILNGLMYLVEEGFEDGSFTCSNTLIHPCGDVKIDYFSAVERSASQDHHKTSQHDSTEFRYIRALGKIVEELMNGYPKFDEVVNADDSHRWPPNSKAVSFLSRTLNSISLDDLMKHPLLHLPWRKEMLTPLVSFASMDTHIGRRYPPK